MLRHYAGLREDIIRTKTVGTLGAASEAYIMASGVGHEDRVALMAGLIWTGWIRRPTVLAGSVYQHEQGDYRVFAYSWRVSA